ncbi:MAG: sigma-70 family RNA polymerase sigma factor [Deltaproteobacteria bacterium]|nr:sigma-70 family RNA polymerase sigma factor [Deltaproteobacteria bacterium]
MTNDDDALLAALRAGEDLAREHLYRTYAAQVLTWTIRLSNPGMDAEDLAHEVFLVALRDIYRFRGDSSVSTWLFGITRRITANARRRHAIRRLVGLERAAELPASGRSPEEDSLHRERRREVQRALQGLSPRHREVLALVDLDQRSTAEAAEMLGVPTGTVHSRLHAARRALAQHLRRRGWDPAGPPTAELPAAELPAARLP